MRRFLLALLALLTTSFVVGISTTQAEYNRPPCFFAWPNHQPLPLPDCRKFVKFNDCDEKEYRA